MKRLVARSSMYPEVMTAIHRLGIECNRRTRETLGEPTDL